MFETSRVERAGFAARRSVVMAREGMVASSQPLAVEAGVSILKKGGNAIDAAIATALTLVPLLRMLGIEEDASEDDVRRAGQVRRRGREEVSPMEGGRRRHWDRQHHDLHLGLPQHVGEEAVVRPDEPVVVRVKREGGARGAHAGVHHRQVNRLRREPVPRASEQIRAGTHVALWDGVGDVHQHGILADAQQDAFHLGHVRVGGAEIGEQGDDGPAEVVARLPLAGGAG